uniref:Enoyl-CoA hydratase n=1 Tax=Arcella intermedia TaxID=1963864 RepID=A0A6B2LH24_9EUKA
MDDKEDNRLTKSFVQQMLNALETVTKKAKNGKKALITTGVGRFYSNGIKTDKPADNEAKDLTNAIYLLLRTILTFPIPTIAVLNGHAFGAGAMLALCHDYRYMNATKGWIGYPLLDIGVILPLPLFEVLKTKLGNPTLVRDLIQLKRRLDGREAERVLFVDRAVEGERLMEEAVGFAARAAGLCDSCEVYQGIKRNMYSTLEALLKETDKPLVFVAKL